MIKLLVILFIIKLYARKNIFKHIKKKHEHDLIKVVRDFEQKKTKFEKLDADIAFIKLCKKEQLTPTFAKVNVSIRNGTYKLKRKIARLVMKTELQNKHREKRKLRKNIRSINVLLSTSLSVIVYNALLHQINIAVKSRIKVIKFRHGKKLHNLKLKQETTNYADERKRSYIKHIVHNFSSYVLSNKEYTALSFGLDHHISTKSKDVAIEVEFEQFYQGLLRNLTHIPDNELTSLKTKLRSTCEKYSEIHVPYKDTRKS